MLGMFFAVVGSGLAVVVILICLIVLIEKGRDSWENRWDLVREQLVKRMIIRFRMQGEYDYNELRYLNKDIDRMNYLFRKYRLDESFDKEERKFIRKLDVKNEFESRR